MRIKFLILLFSLLPTSLFAQDLIDSYAVFTEKLQAEEYKLKVQIVLDLNREGYSGLPWVYICSFKIWNDTFIVPLPLKESKFPLLSKGNILKTLPIQPIKENKLGKE